MQFKQLKVHVIHRTALNYQPFKVQIVLNKMQTSLQPLPLCTKTDTKVWLCGYYFENFLENSLKSSFMTAILTLNSEEMYNSFSNAPWYYRASWLCKLSIQIVKNRYLYNFFVKTTKQWLGGRKTTRFRTHVYLNFFLVLLRYPRGIFKSHYESFCVYNQKLP